MRRQTLYGIEFVTETTIEEIADHLIAETGTPSDRWRSVVTPNVDHLVRYAKSPEERHVAQTAALALPDGMPIVWSSRLLGRPLTDRLAGSDLFAALWERVIERQRSMTLVVAHDAVADALLTANPRAHCIVPPFFGVEDDLAIGRITDEVLDRANNQRTDFVVLGLSMAKSHRLAMDLALRVPPAHGAPLLLLLGASAEFHVGIRTRAPRWMQRAGLEWMHRLLQDPRAMARRYLLEDPAFIKLVLSEWRSRGRKSAGGAQPPGGWTASRDRSGDNSP
jgi:N-acetylglucosaminyldiphosphoundecaprenol N-acetyl-beta-D-mannosaminyltransferase